MFSCVYIIICKWFYVIILPIYFRVASLALGQSYDCPSASEVTLKYMGKVKLNQTTTKQSRASAIRWEPRVSFDIKLSGLQYRNFHWEGNMLLNWLILRMGILIPIKKQGPGYYKVTWWSWYLKSPASWLFVEQLVQANIKNNIKTLHYCPFVRVIHWLPVDFPHKAPEMQKASVSMSSCSHVSS